MFWLRGGWVRGINKSDTCSWFYLKKCIVIKIVAHNTHGIQELQAPSGLNFNGGWNSDLN